jgi:hypothetical protein
MHFHSKDGVGGQGMNRPLIGALHLQCSKAHVDHLLFLTTVIPHACNLHAASRMTAAGVHKLQLVLQGQ